MILNNITTDNIIDFLSSPKAGRGWIQPSIDQSYVPVLNQIIIHEIYAATADEKINVMVEANQSWFLTKEWQKLEAEAEKDIAEGRFTSHNNMDDFITDLDN
jgi:hypothetical protein